VNGEGEIIADVTDEFLALGHQNGVRLTTLSEAPQEEQCEEYSAIIGIHVFTGCISLHRSTAN